MTYIIIYKYIQRISQELTTFSVKTMANNELLQQMRDPWKKMSPKKVEFL